MLVTVSVEDLESAFCRWEADRRSGNTLSVKEVDEMSSEELAKASARCLIQYLTE